MLKKNKRIVIGLSGGVDSSVAAFLLKQQNYDVIGIFMRNWISYDETNCYNWIQDSIDAMLVAEQLNIPFKIIDFSDYYKKCIINNMFLEYSIGNTPNPDIVCNKEIKFNLFLKTAFSLGAYGIATGHYVIKESFIKNKKSIFKLRQGKDLKKNQSYFLCQLNQYQLSKSFFPLGKLTKIEVRQIATKLGLITAKKKDSQGLCFIGKLKFRQFLEKNIPIKKGKIIEILHNNIIYYKKININLNKEDYLFLLAKKIMYQENDGKCIGIHNGAYFFTKGQRKGLKIGGYKYPIFVLETDIKNNIVYVGMGKNHPGLYKKVLFIKNKYLHWIREDLKLSIGSDMIVNCQTRYNQILQEAKIYQTTYGLYIEFKKKQNSITSGQYAVWYINDEMIGSGIID